MKIIFSNYDDLSNPYYGGGGASSIHQVAKRLAKKHNVTVITGKYPSSKNTTLDNVKYKRAGMGFLGPYIGMLTFSLLLPLHAITKDYDIWLESFTPPFSTGFLPLFSKKPVIALVHMLSAQDMKRKYKLPFSWIENIGLKLYDNFIVTSDDSKEKIKKINQRARFAIIPNGVSIPKKTRDKDKHTLYMGRIEIKQKGIDLLLRAYKEIYKKTKIKLLIAGSGNNSEIIRLKKLILSQNLQGKVIYVGKIKGKKWELAYRNSKLVFLPSRFDTYPLVALEAASFSKPLVIFDIQSLNWIPKDIALRAKSFDSQSLASQTIKLLNDKKLNRLMGNNAFKFAKKRSWTATTRKYLKTISQVVNLKLK